MFVTRVLLARCAGYNGGPGDDFVHTDLCNSIS